MGVKLDMAKKLGSYALAQYNKDPQKVHNAIQNALNSKGGKKRKVGRKSTKRRSKKSKSKKSRRVKRRSAH